MLGTIFWSGFFTLFFGVATYGCLAIWDRRIKRDTEAARHLVAARELALRQQEEAERRTAEEIAASERRHRALTEAGAIAVWRAEANGVIVGVEGWTTLTGQAAAEVCGHPGGWLDAVHPEDRAGAAEAWAQAVATGSDMDIEYRVRTPQGQWRWCRSRGVPVRMAPDPMHPDGQVLEWIGVMEDIDARRRAEEDRLLLSREVNHRAKNLLAVVQTVVRLTGAEDPAAFTTAVTARISALARAHTLLAEQDWRGADLRSIAERELAAFMGEPARVTLPESSLPLVAAAVQPLTLVLHELATNAAKYGCLSGTSGSLVLDWQIRDDELRICWTEAGGPAPPALPSRQGFGSRLVDMTVRQQLGGRIEREWQASGLLCRIVLPAVRVVEDKAERFLATQDAVA